MNSKFQYLISHKGFIKYFKNTSWLFVEKIFRIIAALLVGIWVARYLGPEQFGIFSYVQSFVGIFATIATLGLDAVVIRELVKQESGCDELISTVFLLKLLGSLIVILLLMVAINFTSNDINTNTLVFIIASATIFQSFNVIDFYFQSKVLSKFVVYANIISLFISSLLKVILILSEAPLIAFAWVILFDSIVLASGYCYFFLKNSTYKIKYFKINTATAINLLRDSWPLILSGIVISIYMKIDQVMINSMLGSEAVGQYAVAVHLSGAWYFIPMVICSSLFPAIIKAKKQSKALYYSRLQKLYDLMVVIAILITLPITFLSDWIVNLLYGDAYSQAGSVLMIHVWSTVFVFLGVASSKWFVAENLQRYAFYRTLLGAVLNVLLNLILIPKYYIYGAAISTLISQVAAAYLFDLFTKPTRNMFVMKTQSLFLLNLRKNLWAKF